MKQENTNKTVCTTLVKKPDTFEETAADVKQYGNGKFEVRPALHRTHSWTLHLSRD